MQNQKVWTVVVITVLCCLCLALIPGIAIGNSSKLMTKRTPAWPVMATGLDALVLTEEEKAQDRVNREILSGVCSSAQAEEASLLSIYFCRSGSLSSSVIRQSELVTRTFMPTLGEARTIRYIAAEMEDGSLVYFGLPDGAADGRYGIDLVYADYIGGKRGRLLYLSPPHYWVYD